MKYKRPVVKRVKLDPEQAILMACSVGGLYFETNLTVCVATGPIAVGCQTTPKGATGGSTAGSADLSTPPS